MQEVSLVTPVRVKHANSCFEINLPSGRLIFRNYLLKKEGLVEEARDMGWIQFMPCKSSLVLDGALLSWIPATAAERTFLVLTFDTTRNNTFHTFLTKKTGEVELILTLAAKKKRWIEGVRFALMRTPLS